MTQPRSVKKQFPISSVVAADRAFPAAVAQLTLAGIAKVMNDDPSIVSPPNPASGSTPPKHKPVWRPLFWAFLCCFLWQALSGLCASFLQLNVPTFLPSVVIAAVILYPACFRKHSPVFRAFMALLIGAALFVCALFLWIVILRPSFGGAT